MTDTFKLALKQEFPESYEHNEQRLQLLKKFSYWTPDDWRKHYDSLEFITFRVLPKGLLFSKLYADLKPPAQSTLIFALAQIYFETKHVDKRHGERGNNPTPIVSNLFTLPLAALQAVGIGSKNTCTKAINILIHNKIIIKHKNTTIGKPNTFSFTKKFINNYVCV